MLSKEAKKNYQEQQAGSKIMAQGVKIQSEDLTDKELTIQDYDKVGSDNGEKHHYFAVAFEELPGNYLLSGSALTKLIDWAEGQNEDIRGERVRFGAKQKLEGGKTYVPVTLL